MCRKPRDRDPERTPKPHPTGLGAAPGSRGNRPLACDNYDFEGDGECGDIFPWHPWQVTVYTQSHIPYFRGYWSNLAD
ncbi:MAG: hypothetical protein U9Q76_08650 [candidate division WOR-3 bacterium]|nr:hypothetical protein [candidate division WOR-3 bacterium]